MKLGVNSENYLWNSSVMSNECKVICRCNFLGGRSLITWADHGGQSAPKTCDAGQVCL